MACEALGKGGRNLRDISGHIRDGISSMKPCGSRRVVQKRGLQAVFRFHTIPDCLQSVSDETGTDLSVRNGGRK